MYQNVEDVELIIPNMPEDFRLKANAIFAVIDYSENETISVELANIFYEKKSGGCVLQNYSTQAKQQNITIPSCPIPFIAKWNKADKIDIEVKITLSEAYKNAGKYPANKTQTLEEIVKDIIYNNFKPGINYKIGETIYPSVFIEILSQNGVSYIINVEIAKKGGDFGVIGLNFYFTQIANIATKDDIKVVYI